MKHYNSIDLLKFFMSFFVVAIHTDYDHTFFTGFICPLVVPMFFVLSGFLLQKK
ncbi:acyltransferase family protein [Bacteroides clarus]